MKRLFAMLLILVMLIPMCLVAQADEVEPKTVETKPFCLSTWSGFESDFTNVYYMPFFWSDSSTLKKTGTARVTCPGLEEYEGKTLAQRLKSYFDTVPEGARYLNFCLVHDAIHATVEDACIMDKAIPIVNEWLEKFLAEYHAIGGKLDGFFVVVEYMRIYGSYIHGEIAKKDDPLIYDKIVKNPVYQEKIRPKLVERGFKFYSPVTEQTPEIFSIHPNSGSQYSQSRAIWDTVMRSYLGQTVTDCCAPLWKYYPDAIVSDYQSKDVKPWVKEISDTGGAMGGGGIQTTAGTASNDNFSYNRPKSTFFTNTDGTPAYKNISVYNNAIFDKTDFNAFLFDANVAKSTYLSSDNKNITYWATPVYYGNNVYYSETLIHMGMVNPKVYHGYIIKGDCGNDDAKYEAALQVVDDCLRDLTNRVGAADRKPIAVDANWNHSFVLSGMNAGGKNVWRITPDISKATKEEFKIKDSDPTFRIGGETVTFPGGKIIADGGVSMVGTCGYWVETAEDVYPVITRDAEYFRHYPSYGEDYEIYKPNTAYIYNNVKPQAIWEPKKNGTGAATVITDPTNAENQVLAVTGSYTLKNVKILKNITAGDTFAEHQGWEVSFTLPADLAADAELVLLNASGSKKVSADGGFKIIGGKVYYSNNGEYVELAGVTLAADTKYTVLRDMDFTNQDAITCDYYVYDAEGKVLGKARNIPVAAMTVPVDYITMTFKNIAGEAVLVDDYRLYATHVATDFYRYDATTGMPVAETEKNDGSTAYRLSWLNGTGKEKTYTVMAAYYDGDTKVSEEAIQEVKMAPYADGVAMGVVENKQVGKTMQLYLQDNNPVEDDVTDNPDAETGNDTETGTENDTGTGTENDTETDIGTENGTDTETNTGTENGTGTGDGTDTENTTGTESTTDKGTEPTAKQDDAAKTDEDSKGGSKTTLIIIIVGAVVVAAAVAVAVILILKKKKKATAIPAEETPEPEEAPAAEETPEE